MDTATMTDELHSTARRALETDPICGMRVDPEEAAGTSQFQGRTYYFCSTNCKREFDRNPATHAGHRHEQREAATDRPSHAPSLNRVAFSATVHCLSGCATGEVLGLVIGTALGWGNWPTIALAVALAFALGYLFTLVPLVRAGMGVRAALALALASDTASITIMEVVDNAVMLLIPGAMDAGLADPLFWGSLAVALLLAGIAAFPVNRWLIARGQGHALVHEHHGHHKSEAAGDSHRAGAHAAHH